MKKRILLYSILTSCSMIANLSYASEITDITPSFTLDQMIVTANRYEKRDVDIAASTQVLTKEDLEKSGTTNVVSALSYVLGVTYMGYGPEGSSLGSKNSNLTIRGVDKGTLVMVNGAPINLNGRYNLEDMPFDGIERIEVIKGGGSVLYGSEAIGGVINIITDNKVQNKISIAAGSRDRQQYDFSYQLKKISFSASSKHWGDKSRTSDLITSTKKMNNYLNDMDRNNLYLSYKFDDKSNLLFRHTESKKDFDYVFGDGYQSQQYYNAVRYNKIYRYKKNFIQYNFDDDKIKGNIYYNDNVSETNTHNFLTSTGKASVSNAYERDKDYLYGIDVHRKWNGKTGKYILGINFQHEYYNPDTYASQEYDKNSYSIYAQWDKMLDQKNNIILSGRQSWAKMTEKTFKNFSGQMQFIHKMTDNQSLYANIGQSYRMPYLKEMYSGGTSFLVGNTELKPEKGIHYEIGWKKEVSNHLWKVAAYNYYIKDNIAYTLGRTGGTSYSTNQDLKNTGIEASLRYHDDTGFRYNLGVSWNNPKSKTRSDNAPSTVTVKDYWDRQYGRMQFSGGVGYSKDKWSADLITTYMWDRVASPTSSSSFSIKPYLLTSFNLSYKADKNSSITFSMENLLNREDNYGGSTTAYYSTPRCFLMKYTYNF